MKTLIIVTLSILSFIGKAQSSIVTTTLVVKGNCGDCKERIENAADIKGVKLLNWDSKSKVATLTYNSDKTNLNKIEKAIANTGHDAGSVKGNDKAYAKLPKCCQYREGVCEEPQN